MRVYHFHYFGSQFLWFQYTDRISTHVSALGVMQGIKRLYDILWDHVNAQGSFGAMKVKGQSFTHHHVQ